MQPNSEALCSGSQMESCPMKLDQLFETNVAVLELSAAKGVTSKKTTTSTSNCRVTCSRCRAIPGRPSSSCALFVSQPCRISWYIPHLSCPRHVPIGQVQAQLESSQNRIRILIEIVFCKTIKQQRLRSVNEIHRRNGGSLTPQMLYGIV